MEESEYKIMRESNIKHLINTRAGDHRKTAKEDDSEQQNTKN